MSDTPEEALRELVRQEMAETHRAASPPPKRSGGLGGCIKGCLTIIGGIVVVLVILFGACLAVISANDSKRSARIKRPVAPATTPRAPAAMDTPVKIPPSGPAEAVDTATKPAKQQYP